MKKLMMLAAMSAGMLMAGDVQQAEAGGRRVAFSIGSSPFGNSFGLSVGRGGFNRGGFNRGFGGFNRGFNRGGFGGFNRGFGGFNNVGFSNVGFRSVGYRPAVIVAPSYGVNYGGFGGGVPVNYGAVSYGGYGGGYSPGCNRGW
ncbi:hypothetical protein OAH18_02675 [bacterium]|nr:hypothetical protein [bacterium]